MNMILAQVSILRPRKLVDKQLHQEFPISAGHL